MSGKSASGKSVSRKTASGKAGSRAVQVSAGKIDRRVRRTRDALGNALLALMQEQSFETITVQQVLDRAHIGRSTFYSHYLGKDDLLLSDVEDFLEDASTFLLRRREDSNRVAPVREFFAHVAEMQHIRAAFHRADKMRDFLELAQGFFARAIKKRLSAISPPGAGRNQYAARSHALAGAMLSLMSWWLDHTAEISAEEMDSLFHQIVWKGIAPEDVPAAVANNR